MSAVTTRAEVSHSPGHGMLEGPARPGQGSRTSTIGLLLLGVPDHGGQLRYAGRWRANY